MTDFRPFLIYLLGVLATVGAMLGLSYVLGQRHTDRATGEIYESGILTTGDARIRFHARFYLVAMIFVAFDLESVFLYTWAVGARELGWPGYYAILLFSAILLIALAHIWRMGGLDFGPAPHRTHNSNA
jgi:NADH-quinone oxidoreductase subunit A